MDCDPSSLAQAAACYCFNRTQFDAVALAELCLIAGGTLPPPNPPVGNIVLGDPGADVVFGNPGTGVEFGIP